MAYPVAGIGFLPTAPALTLMARRGGSGMDDAKNRMDVAADLRQARALIEESMRRLQALPKDDRPVDPVRAAKTLNDAFLVLDAAIDEIEA
jgi:hypothetical protein